MIESKLKNQEKLFKKKLDKFKSDGVSFRKGNTASVIKKAEKKLNTKLDNELKEFYINCKSYGIGWKGVYEGFEIGGSISIRPITILDSLKLGGNKELNLSEINSSSVDKKNLYVFDTIDNLGNYVLIHIEKEQSQLYLFTYGKYLNKINLTITEYVDKSIEYLGMFLWQQFYIDTPESISNYFLWDDRCLNVLNLLLSEEEYNYVLDKTKNIENKIAKKKEINREVLIKKINDLKNNKIIKVNEFDINNNVNSSIIMKSNESLRRLLPNSIIDFYEQSNGLSFEWSKGEAGGGINFLPMEEMFAGEHWWRYDDWNDTDIFKDVLWFGEEDEEDLKIIKQLKPLELISGSSDFIGFLVNEAKEFELYYSYGRNDIMKLPISIDKYIHLSMRLLGIYGWQEYYLKGSDKIDAAVGLLDKISQFFPDFKEEEFLS